MLLIIFLLFLSLPYKNYNYHALLYAFIIQRCALCNVNFLKDIFPLNKNFQNFPWVFIAYKKEFTRRWVFKGSYLSLQTHLPHSSS